MAFLECKLFAESLGMCTTVSVILPQRTTRQIGLQNQAANARAGDFAGHPVLYLLHGLSDDHSIWMRRTAIERYVAPLGLAVVMPEVHRSFYTDMKYGQRYFMYISEELPRLMQSFFRINSERENTYVAGLSMGGYGAMKLALTNPENYAAAASLSGVTDICWAARERLNILPDYELIFGDPQQLPGTKNDLMHVANSLAQRCEQQNIEPPRLYMCCGDQDHLLEGNHRFREHLQSIDVDHTYEEHPGETHEWSYWDRMMPHVLKWMELS